jgi:ParB family chromosome partitioning protein
MQTTIPFDKLYPSKLNVRKTDPDNDVEIMALDLTVRGLIHNLAVVDEGRGDGMLGIVGGRRRWLALKLLDDRGKWPEKVDREAIPIRVFPEEEGREISLAENRNVPMNPADEVEAYRDIISDYRKLGLADPVGRLARHFQKPVRYIEQRLRLADLAEDILAALRSGRIDVDVAKAYASVSDHGLQLEAFAAQERQGPNAPHRIQSIRAILAGRTYRPSDKWAVYVGVDTYEAAGGRVDCDFFMGIAGDDQILLDAPLMDRLVRERGEPEARRLAAEHGYPDGQLAPWGPDSHVPPKVPPGYEFVPNGALRFGEEERRDAILLCRIAADGSRLEASEHAFRLKPARAAQAGPAAPAGTVAALGLVRQPLDRMPTTAELEAQRRNRFVWARAAKMAVPSFAGTALEGRAVWPADPVEPVPPIGRTAEGDYLAVVQIVIPKEEFEAAVDQADWQLVEEEAAATKKGAAPAERVLEAEAAR